MIVNDLVKQALNALDKGDEEYSLAVHSALLAVHSKVIACHCECLGMNAENMIAAIKDERPPYSDDSYLRVLQKWELVDDNFKPSI